MHDSERKRESAEEAGFRRSTQESRNPWQNDPLYTELGGRAYFCLAWSDDPTILLARLRAAGHEVWRGLPLPAWQGSWP